MSIVNPDTTTPTPTSPTGDTVHPMAELTVIAAGQTEPTAAPEVATRQRKRPNRFRGALLMLLPGILFFFVFSYLPMAGVVIAFKDYQMSRGIIGSPWNNFANFKALLLGEGFLDALRNTLTISSLRLTLGFIAPIILALLINEVRIKWYARGVQTLTYLPFFFSWVILGGIILMVFSVEDPVNQLFAFFGLGPFPFLTQSSTFLGVLILSGIWHGVGYGAVIYLAALAGIDPTLYEAARVDGASRWQQAMHITLPSLVPTIITLFILNLGGILNAGFDQILNLYNPLVYDIADILDTYIYRQTTNLNFGAAAAAGLFKSLVGMTMVVAANAVANRVTKGEQGIW